MGNNHNETTHIDGNGDKCGSGWPNTDSGTDSPAHEGVGGSTGNTCDGNAQESNTLWPRRLTGENKCEAHRGAKGRDDEGHGWAVTGNRIERSKINNLRDLIKAELGNWGENFNGTIHSTYPKVEELNAMVDAIKGAYDEAKQGKTLEPSLGIEPTADVLSFNGNISAYKIQKLVDAYNTMVGDCICNSDCGANTQCSCHNNCGCHY